VLFTALGALALPVGYLPGPWEFFHIACAVAALGLAVALRFLARNSQSTEPTPAPEESP
jgi:hypothetical protein